MTPQQTAALRLQLYVLALMYQELQRHNRELLRKEKDLARRITQLEMIANAQHVKFSLN